MTNIVKDVDGHYVTVSFATPKATYTAVTIGPAAPLFFTPEQAAELGHILTTYAKAAADREANE